MTQQAKTTTYRKPATDAAREKANAYRRRYRQANPERVKRWRDDYIMRRAARLMAEQAAASGDDLDGGQVTDTATDGR